MFVINCRMTVKEKTVIQQLIAHAHKLFMDGFEYRAVHLFLY